MVLWSRWSTLADQRISLVGWSTVTECAKSGAWSVSVSGTDWWTFSKLTNQKVLSLMYGPPALTPQFCFWKGARRTAAAGSNSL